jgi:RNA recognition motif-containing protein
VLYRKSATIATEENKASRGFGYVEMESPKLAQVAIVKLNNYELDGRKIRVSLFNEPGFLFVLITKIF